MPRENYTFAPSLTLHDWQLRMRMYRLWSLFFIKLFCNPFMDITRVPNSLDPDQVQHSLDPDLSPNCMQRPPRLEVWILE